MQRLASAEQISTGGSCRVEGGSTWARSSALYLALGQLPLQLLRQLHELLALLPLLPPHAQPPSAAHRICTFWLSHLQCKHFD